MDNENFYSESSVENLGIILENGEMGQRVQKWAKESSTQVKGRIRTKMRSILVNAKQLLGIKTFGSTKSGVRVLIDINAYNKLVRFIEGSTTYNVANYSINQVLSFGKNINIVSTTFGKAIVKANKLSKIYDSMNSEIRSPKMRRLTQALNETKPIKVPNEKVFKTRIAPLIRNLLVATKKINLLIETMIRSFRKLIMNIETLPKRTHFGASSAHNRKYKNDLMGRCLGYVSFANKFLIDVCEEALQRISSFLNYYYNIFNTEE